ncbi:hypothetical protein [Hymenobacter coccineus]|uniref:DUF4834 domain-containing protein n=1 Tax=Hymenobacter coccineus TaxID=1908235 RepID=A0A1G1TMA1_9BACT|nr:hypothetical protein [Hymenobacter coccineus]OGX92006.1 hypothetical protein BEN49_17760 [Hymenobacter coccineus]
MSFWLILLLSFFFIRYILPSLMRAALGGFVRQQVHKAQQQGGGPFGPMNGGPFGPQGPQRPAGPPPAPGQVHVDYVPPTASTPHKGSDRIGEYVDFEEIK